MMTGLLTVTHFLVGIFFNLFLFALWLRVILRYYRVSSLHPVSQMVDRITNPVLAPIEHFLFLNTSRLKRYDWSAIALIVMLEILKFILFGLLVYGAFLPLSYLIIFVIADLVIQPCNLLFYALLIRVIMSWINPLWRNHPAADLLVFITEPLIQLGRKIVPNISGFDFSPFVIMIILKIITLFFQASLPLPLI